MHGMCISEGDSYLVGLDRKPFRSPTHRIEAVSLSPRRLQRRHIRSLPSVGAKPPWAFSSLLGAPPHPLGIPQGHTPRIPSPPASGRVPCPSPNRLLWDASRRRSLLRLRCPEALVTRWAPRSSVLLQQPDAGTLPGSPLQ